MRFTAKRANRGFSLLEMLITTLILSLVMVISTSGVAVAQKLYRSTMAKADAQMILSQIERNLRDDLSFADQYKLGPDGATVTQYHKNGFWYGLENGNQTDKSPYENFLYKTFYATGESQDAEFDSASNPILYEPLSSNNSDRLEDVSVSVPKIVYVYDETSAENYFYVYDLSVELDGTVIAGVYGEAADGEEAPYLIIRALNRVEAQD